MKKLLIMFVSLIVTAQNAFCADSVTSDIKHALKASYDMNYISVVGSLLFVIFLIYITGVIYAKLNAFGCKTMKHQFKDLEDTKIVVLSTTPIGHNRTLHVVSIGGHKMLIGASQNSVTLIKDFDNTNQEIDVKTLPKNIVKDINLDKIYPVNENYDYENCEIEFKNELTNVEDERVNTDYNSEDFGLYKKYL